MEILGWASAAALSLCGVPQAVRCARDGHARGLSGAFVVMWLLGEMGALAYLLTKPSPTWPIVANYAVNLVVVAVISYYKVRGCLEERRANR